MRTKPVAPQLTPAVVEQMLTDINIVLPIGNGRARIQAFFHDWPVALDGSFIGDPIFPQNAVTERLLDDVDDETLTIGGHTVTIRDTIEALIARIGAWADADDTPTT